MVSSLFSHNASSFVTGISSALEIAGIEMLVSFFLHGVTNCRTLFTRSLGHSIRPPETFGGLKLPTGVIKLVDQSLNSIGTCECGSFVS